MFDLFRSREKSVRIILGALLLLVAVSMLSYLVPSYNTGAVAGDTVVADVAGTPITMVDVQKLIQMTMRNRQFPASMLANYVPMLIDQMVTERALTYEAT